MPTTVVILYLDVGQYWTMVRNSFRTTHKDPSDDHDASMSVAIKCKCSEYSVYGISCLGDWLLRQPICHALGIQLLVNWLSTLLCQAIALSRNINIHDPRSTGFATIIVSYSNDPACSAYICSAVTSINHSLKFYWTMTDSIVRSDYMVSVHETTQLISLNS